MYTMIIFIILLVGYFIVSAIEKSHDDLMSALDRDDSTDDFYDRYPTATAPAPNRWIRTK